MSACGSQRCRDRRVAARGRGHGKLLRRPLRSHLLHLTLIDERRGERFLALQAERVEESVVLVKGGVGGGEQLVAGEDGVGARHEHDGLLDRGEGHATGREAHLGDAGTSSLGGV